MKTFKQKMQYWAERRARLAKMWDEGKYSLREIGDMQKPRISGQQVKHLIDAYKNEAQDKPINA